MVGNESCFRFTKEDAYTSARHAAHSGRLEPCNTIVSNGRRADGWPTAVSGSRNDPGRSPAPDARPRRSALWSGGRKEHAGQSRSTDSVKCCRLHADVNARGGSSGSHPAETEGLHPCHSTSVSRLPPPGTPTTARGIFVRCECEIDEPRTTIRAGILGGV